LRSFPASVIRDASEAKRYRKKPIISAVCVPPPARRAPDRKKAKRGRCEGAKPYGYFDGEADVIDRMKALRESGLGFDRIAASLNADGIKPRRSEKCGG
jgi:hypothetical protein